MFDTERTTAEGIPTEDNFFRTRSITFAILHKLNRSECVLPHMAFANASNDTTVEDDTNAVSAISS